MATDYDPQDPQSMVQCALDVQEAIENLDSEVYERREDFFDSVASGAAGVAATIESTGRVTANQARALLNWRAAVAKYE